jgi:hypothetical protein
MCKVATEPELRAVLLMIDRPHAPGGALGRAYE